MRPYKVRPAADRLPGRWETGTQNHEGMAGVAAAVDYLADLGRHHHPEAKGQSARRSWPPTTRSALTSRSLLEQLVPGCVEIPGLTFYGITDPARFHQRVPTVAVRMAGRSPHELAAISASAAFLPGTATTTR